MKERPGVKKNQGQCLHEPSVVPLSLENWLQIIVHLCGTEKTQCLLSSDIWIPYFANVWFQKLKYLYPLHRRLFDLHLHPPRIFHSRGSLMAPFPPGISRIFKQGLSLPILGTRGFSRVRREFSVSAKGWHIFSQGIAYHPLEIQSGFGTWNQRKWILTQLRKYSRILLQWCSVNIC